MQNKYEKHRSVKADRTYKDSFMYRICSFKDTWSDCSSGVTLQSSSVHFYTSECTVAPCVQWLTSNNVLWDFDDVRLPAELGGVVIFILEEA